MSAGLTEKEKERCSRMLDAREQRAEAEKKARIARATIDAIQRNCDHRVTNVITCCGKPEGSACAICGKLLD